MIHVMERLSRNVGTALIAALAVAIMAMTLGAWLRWGMRCDEGCYLRSAEAGAPWTRYRDSWQWHAQFAVALLAMLAAGAGLVTVRSRPPAGIALAAAACALAGSWLAWYLATPLHQ
jgi:hypothetical protein